MEFVVFVKRDCSTSKMVTPMLRKLTRNVTVIIYAQDDPDVLEERGGAGDDCDLEESWHQNIESVPSLIRFEERVESLRSAGWD